LVNVVRVECKYWPCFESMVRLDGLHDHSERIVLVDGNLADLFFEGLPSLESVLN